MIYCDRIFFIRQQNNLCQLVRTRADSREQACFEFGLKISDVLFSCYGMSWTEDKAL